MTWHYRKGIYGKPIWSLHSSCCFSFFHPTRRCEPSYWSDHLHKNLPDSTDFQTKETALKSVHPFWSYGATHTHTHRQTDTQRETKVSTRTHFLIETKSDCVNGERHQISARNIGWKLEIVGVDRDRNTLGVLAVMLRIWKIMIPSQMQVSRRGKGEMTTTIQRNLRTKEL